MSRRDYMLLREIHIYWKFTGNLVSRSLSNRHRYILWKGNYLKSRGVGDKQHGKTDRGNDEKSLL